MWAAPDFGFSPPVSAWLSETFRDPTGPQRLGWPAIARGEDVLIAAPTGSGKTLASFLVVIDRLVRRALAGALADEVEAVYVSPLRALSHDIQRNLEVPLAGIRAAAERQGTPLPEIRCMVRTGDTPAYERAKMTRRPPHLIVTTPESLYLLVTSPRSRNILKTAKTLIVDEIHAVVRDKRGSHLSLTIERLAAITTTAPQRIGLSATQKPLELLARWLAGSRRSNDDGSPRCTIIDLGHQRDLDLEVETPSSDDLSAVPSGEQWAEIIAHVGKLVAAHKTTLIFVNTRRLAERVTHQLGLMLKETLGDDVLAAHHGSLSRERRFRVEERLKSGSLRALVATASLELGIDIGHIDLVIQLGSPRAIATFLQRVGRSGHALAKTPKGRILPTTRDELIEVAALVHAVKAGRLDRIRPPIAPLDILAQQLVAHCAGLTDPRHELTNQEDSDPVTEDALFDLVRGAAPFADLDRSRFDAVLTMVEEGFETPKGRRGNLLFRDKLKGAVRARRGALLTALTSGGAIPDQGDYKVVLDPGETFLGTVNEDWAIESMAGDIFVLGSHSWRIRRIENGKVRVVDAEGAPPSIPFWLGEAPGRTDELSIEVSLLREKIVGWLDEGEAAAAGHLATEACLSREAAVQAIHYVAVQLQATGMVPTRRRLFVERFFDDAGGMQLVIHAPYGMRINRAFGLALRKRFCRAFNQELQAAALDDALVLSLGNPQTFPIETIGRFLNSKTIVEVLEQAMLGSPVFAIRWRWNATRALMVLRHQGSSAVPFNIQRMVADDLLAAAFPDQTACQEHVTYPIRIPAHPLVRQTLDDCLHEAADLRGLEALLLDLESGQVTIVARDVVEPSPFAHEILNAKPYAFLDDAPLEERRTRAVALRTSLPEKGRDLARLDPDAIARVRGEAALDLRSADETYEALLDLLALPAATTPFAGDLVSEGRAVVLHAGFGDPLLVAIERLRHVQTLWPGVAIDLAPLPPRLDPGPLAREAVVDRAVRSWLAVVSPAPFSALASHLFVPVEDVAAACQRLFADGIVILGRFDPAVDEDQASDRALLARMHRGTLDRLRREIEPVSAEVLLRFLVRWQHAAPDTSVLGEDGLREVLRQLAGWPAPVQAWEAGLLRARVHGYRPRLLDHLCLSGEIQWARLQVRETALAAVPTRATKIAFFSRDEASTLLSGYAADEASVADLRGPAATVLALLEKDGASFAADLRRKGRLLPAELDEALGELVFRGLATADGFSPLRRLITRTRKATDDQRRFTKIPALEAPGRWQRVVRDAAPLETDARAEATAERLLRRYGIVFRDLIVREDLVLGWREIHRALRRLEARGIIRGGRFVIGFTGEQFAKPEVIPLLRDERRRTEKLPPLTLSVHDPLNLSGVVVPGERLQAKHCRRVILDGSVFSPESGASITPGRPF